MNAIRDGETSMHSKWHFKRKTLAATAGLILAALTTLLVISLIIFALRQSGAWEAAAFGTTGARAFFSALPWILITAALIFIIIIEIMIQRFAFAYHRPVLYSIALITGITLIGGYTVAQTSIHDKLEKTQNTITQKIYTKTIKKPSQLHMGQITNLNETGFKMKTKDKNEYKVIITPKTKTPKQFEAKPRMMISVIGPHTSTTIQAYGIRPMNKKLHIRFKPGDKQTQKQIMKHRLQRIRTQ